MMYSVTPFGFWLISQPGLFLGLTYDLSLYVAPRMSKHYLKQCFIRYFNMQFSKNNVVRATLQENLLLNACIHKINLFCEGIGKLANDR